MPTVTRPRVYLAGPDVFRSDAEQHFALLVAVCEKLGIEALSPFDELIDASTSPQAIYEANMEHLRRADGVIANLAPFRGAEPDSGTVFEVGVAIALGLPVVGYGVRGTYAERLEARQPLERVHGILRDADDQVVEDFGLPLNLMLASSVQLAETAEHALQLLTLIWRDEDAEVSLQ
jgi:nucleoside 2-deoxyribosyltransferase